MATINSIGVGLSGISGASSFVGRDANSNTTVNSYIPGSALINVAGSGTTTLTVDSAQIQLFSGAGISRSCKLPVVSTLTIGQSYRIINNSNISINVVSSGSNLILEVLPSYDAIFTCLLLTGTNIDSWGISSATTAPAVVLSPLTDQTIDAHNLTLSNGDFISTMGGFASGDPAGGNAGYLYAYSSSANKGALVFSATDSAGNFNGTITNASLTTARSWSLPDLNGTITALGNTTTGTAGTIVFATSPTITTPNIAQINVSNAPVLALTNGFNYLKLIGGTGHGDYLLYQGFDPAGNDVPLYFNAGSSGSISWGTQATSDQFVFATGGAKLTTLNFINTNTAQTITVPDATGTLALTSGSTSVSVAGTTQALAANITYIFNNAAATTGTLPLTANVAIGDIVKIKGRSSAAWIIQANTGQTIKFGASASSVAGTATSALGSDSIQFTYVAADEWSVDWAVSSLITLA